MSSWYESEILNELRKIHSTQKEAAERESKLLQAFNEVAAELRELNKNLNPQIQKPSLTSKHQSQ